MYPRRIRNLLQFLHTLRPSTESQGTASSRGVHPGKLAHTWGFDAIGALWEYALKPITLPVSMLPREHRYLQAESSGYPPHLDPLETLEHRFEAKPHEADGYGASRRPRHRKYPRSRWQFVSVLRTVTCSPPLLGRLTHVGEPV